MKKFTVRRSNWARGNNVAKGGTLLLDRAGCMCCLGFAMNQITRIPKRRLDGYATPEDVAKRKTFLTMVDDFRIINNDLAENAIEINDDCSITDEERESKLKKLFRKHKVIVKFVD